MKYTTLLLGTAAFAALSSPAFADDGAIEKRLDAMQHMIETQQSQIEAQKKEIGDLRHALSHRGVKFASEPVITASEPAPALESRVADQQTKIDDLVAKFDAAQTQTRLAKQEQPVWSFAGGRPTITSSDGRFSLAIRAIGQFDTAYYMQDAHATQLAAGNGPDLSSGSNFRRVQLGLQGKVFGDWSYFFNYDFAGSGGNETPGHIQQAYVEYDGFAPFAVRIGAFPPSAGLEDNTGSPDTIFLERNSPSDMARNIAGGDGRDGIGIIYSGDRWYGALTYTGDKIQDAGVFDEQQALVGRLSNLAFSSDDTKVVVSANGTYVFKVADTAAGMGAPRTITLSDPPELTVDNTGTKLVSTGALNAEDVWQWGVESAVQWQNVYAQAGYFGFGVDLRGVTPASSQNFDGWYLQGTWVLTGESRNYNTASGAFSNPKPRVNFSRASDGWGAWELAGRYSDLNLNDNAGSIGSALPAGGNRGGDQRIWTAALNWYPNSVLKFALQWQTIDVDRIGTIPAGFGHGTLSNAQVGQSLNTVSLRSQIAF
jgi:phosphate-selective porin OprO/OprP